MASSKCPICGRAPEGDATAKYRPFCSRRCADVDLAKWLGGSYAIPGEDIRLDLGESENADE